MNLRMIGLDLSLDAPGYAWTTQNDPPVDVLTIPARTDDPQDRAGAVVTMLNKLAAIRPHLAVVEDIFVGKNSRTGLSLAELHGVVKLELRRLHIPWVMVSPMRRAMYATGRGTSPKADVLAAARYTYGPVVGGASRIRTTDDADSLILLAMGMDHYGQPLVEVDGTHRRALKDIHWTRIYHDDFTMSATYVVDIPRGN